MTPTPTDAPRAEPCGHSTLGALGGHELVCTQPAGHHGPHRSDSGTQWSPLPDAGARRRHLEEAVVSDGDRIWVGATAIALGVAGHALDWPFGAGILVGFGLGTLIAGLIQNRQANRRR